MMKKTHMKAVFFLVGVVFLAGCAGPRPMPTFKPLDLNPKLKSGGYVQKVDNFEVIIDTSGSMADLYKGTPKVEQARDIVGLMNRTAPALDVMAALRMFGQTGFFQPDGTALLYGPTRYSQAGFEEALRKICHGQGGSPLDRAIDAAGQDLSTAKGKIALIVVSDGLEMEPAPAAAKTLKGRFGDRLCIYTIVAGNDPSGKKLLERVAQAGECGFSISGDQVSSSQGMADFVERVFLAKAMVKERPDSDGDGVYDDKDLCPGTPAGVFVDKNGCPLDTDGDGVYDYKDKCPGTPRGVRVDATGCPYPAALKDSDGDGVSDNMDKCPDTPKGAKVNAVGCWVLTGLLFDTNKWDIKPRFYPILDEAVEVLKRNPDLKVKIEGHTDSVGSARYNQQLSEKRARAVMEYLVKQGIKRERLSAEGYGLTRPIASNLTPEGRAQNRRVELTPSRD
jgi:OOP family OmpA-OmpF porin